MPDHPSIEQLEGRVRADPLSIAFAALAEEYRRAGRYEEAIEVCRTGLVRHPAYISARVTLGRALVAIGQLAEAADELEDVLRSAPENLAAIRTLAEIHQRRGGVRAESELHPDVPESAGPAAAAAPDVAPGADLTGTGIAIDVGSAFRRAPGDVTTGEPEHHKEEAQAVAATPALTPTPDEPSRDQTVLRELQRFLDGALTLKRDRAAGHDLL